MDRLPPEIIRHIYSYCDIHTKISCQDSMLDNTDVSDYINDLLIKMKILEENNTAVEDMFMKTSDCYNDLLTKHQELTDRCDLIRMMLF